MRSTAQQYFPNEIGGICLGSYSYFGTEEANITEILVPQYSTSSNSLFTRKVRGINKTIKRRYCASNGNVIYLGEWHSHPFGSSEYSELDRRSIKAIAENKHVAIFHPILCIMHHSNPKWTESFYVFYEGELHKYETV
ncbi:hypothetical protein ES708_33023 [subsurface metagenome]